MLFRSNHALENTRSNMYTWCKDSTCKSPTKTMLSPLLGSLNIELLQV